MKVEAERSQGQRERLYSAAGTRAAPSNHKHLLTPPGSQTLLLQGALWWRPLTTHWFDWCPAAPSRGRPVEEAADVQSCSRTHQGLQLSGSSVAQLLEAAEVLQQGQSLDPAHPGDLLDHVQDLGVQQLEAAPPPERVLPAVQLDLEGPETPLRHAEEGRSVEEDSG